MQNIKRRLVSALFPRYRGYFPQVFRHRIRSVFRPVPEHKYLFVLCSTFSGSTLLNELLSTSRQVSANHTRGTREGQTLPTVRPLMFDPPERRWDPSAPLDWEAIQREWMKYWDQTKPILLEKSPPNLLRAEAIASVFRPAYFLVMTRNPYAQCESIMRRSGWSATASAEFAMLSLKFQKHNLEVLPNALFVTYEHLTDSPEEVVGKIKEWLPESSDLNPNQEFNAHNYLQKPLAIQNLNAEKIKALSPQDMADINRVFSSQSELLTYFGYALIGD
ncbi:MAG TPA: hypothetical protein DCP28_03845 [Cytophagales bacterium]|nr:hypothetical protein [Cytophagales bacterium]